LLTKACFDALAKDATPLPFDGELYLSEVLKQIYGDKADELKAQADAVMAHAYAQLGIFKTCHDAAFFQLSAREKEVYGLNPELNPAHMESEIRQANDYYRSLVATCESRNGGGADTTVNCCRCFREEMYGLKSCLGTEKWHERLDSTNQLSCGSGEVVFQAVASEQCKKRNVLCVLSRSRFY
jgi:hypothetical protein